jgi:EAL domain-containing protein (putative c-di-GMP-specific phosphodiesterase class I)
MLKPIAAFLIQTWMIICFESLARWHHPINGFIAPNIFIPLAEELGLMNVLSEQLFSDSCRDAANWPEYVSLSFNFSSTQLSDKNFAQNVLTILADTGLAPYRLEAEITESAIVSDFETTRHVIRTLRNAGIRIVIDDFGTGYSGLSQLYELRFDKLKVDKRFIQEIGKSSESDIFMRAIFGLCKGLDLSVTAEGIESVAQADAAFAYGAHEGQGFFFSKAVPADRVPQLFIEFPQAKPLRDKNGPEDARDFKTISA